jgi:vesicle-associated membrane protein 7
MHTYNTAPPADELARAQTELNQVKNIMVQNVEQILSRGERIELLVDKTDVMAGQATAFRRGARNVRRQMWWRNTKIMALCGLVGLVRHGPAWSSTQFTYHLTFSIRRSSSGSSSRSSAAQA